MPRLLIIICLVIVTACGTGNNNNGKTSSSGRDSLLIDSLSHLPAVLFEKAVALEKSNITEAVKIYEALKNKDSLSLIGNMSDERLRFINGEVARKDFIEDLSDSWEWSWKGTNWGTIETPGKGRLQRKLIIHENGDIDFYQNDSLIRKDQYEIKNPNPYIGNRYLLELKNSKEIFAVYYNKTRLTITEPNCVCGCETNEYFRKWKRGI
jgi:hypothetical protein